MPFYDQSAYSAHLRAQTFASRSPVTGLALSPGGTKLASASAAGTLALHDVSGHSAATSTLAPASPMSSWPLRETNVSAVATSRTLLLVAGTAGLRAFSWAALQDAHGKAAEAPSHRLLRAGAVRSVVAGSGCDDLLVVVEDGEVVRFGPDGREADVFAAQPCLDSTNCLARSSRSPEVFMTGGNDGSVCYYDARMGSQPVRSLHVKPSTKARNDRGSSCVTSLCMDADESFAMVASKAGQLCVVHVASGTVVSSASVNFIPQALSFSQGVFYCGASDRSTEDSLRSTAMLRFDLQCNAVGAAPSSASSVYAIAVDADSGIMAAGGYSQRKYPRGDAPELIDVYYNPPVRSFSVSAV